MAFPKSLELKPLGMAALLGAATLSLAACNTVQGAGQDIQSGGEVIEDVAKDVEREIND